MRRGLTLLLGLVLGCGPSVVESPEQEMEPPGTSTGTVDVTTGLDPEPVGSSTSVAPLPGTSSSSGEPGSSSTTGCVDMGPTVEPDPDNPDSRCLYDGLDCGCGYRCTVYVEDENDNDNPWGNSGCFPVDPDPVGLGDPCIHEDFSWSGRDNCPPGSMCEDWDRDGQGVCREFCEEGNPDYACTEENAVPYSGCQKCGCVCQVSCDPLGSDCAEGEGCYIAGAIGLCAPDASGEGGGFAESCEFINGCDAGSMCVSPDVVPGCPDGSAGCCTVFCDVADPQCPDGTVCELIWDEPAARPLADLGICVDPASLE